jgi:histidyl-tRNA synthetase
MTTFQPVRGTHDYMGAQARAYQKIVSTALAVAQTYGYEEIMTPIFEQVQVFSRSLGDTTDVVSKEMYVFEDRGGDQLALRPEGTAGVARAFISNGLTQSLPQKFFYSGPMFRYERPQKGRQRQFHQIGVEFMGVHSPLADAETIALGAHVLKELGIDQSITLKLNTLGDLESRTAYRAALVAYFSQYSSQLSPDSQVRLAKNPLRILDSKDPADQVLVQGAPQREAYLTPESQQFFAGVREALEGLGIAYEIDPYLVRGLDYYSHTAFEFVSTALGAQSTALGGGRYDGLIEQLGGPAISCIGWGAGIERMMLLMDETAAPPPDVVIVPVSAEQEGAAFHLAQKAREQGIQVWLDYQGNMGKRMKKAAKMNAPVVWVLGEEEMSNDQVTRKDMVTGAQEVLSVAQAMGMALKDRDDSSYCHPREGGDPLKHSHPGHY